MTHTRLIMVQWCITLAAIFVIVIGKRIETTLIGLGIGICCETVTLMAIRSIKRDLVRQGKKVSKNPFLLP